MRCETKGYCKDTRGLGKVLPKVEKVVIGILGSRNWHSVLVSHHTQGRVQWFNIALCILDFCSMHWRIQHCKLVINIDGTHLYGKYQWVLLIAMATDANNKVLPLWTKSQGQVGGWFLECFRISLEDVIANKDIWVISDQHKGIKNAIANWPRDDDGRVWVFHRYCLQHVASNFNTHF